MQRYKNLNEPQNALQFSLQVSLVHSAHSTQKAPIDRFELNVWFLFFFFFMSKIMTTFARKIELLLTHKHNSKKQHAKYQEF